MRKTISFLFLFVITGCSSEFLLGDPNQPPEICNSCDVSVNSLIKEKPEKKIDNLFVYIHKNEGLRKQISSILKNRYRGYSIRVSSETEVANSLEFLTEEQIIKRAKERGFSYILHIGASEDIEESYVPETITGSTSNTTYSPYTNSSHTNTHFSSVGGYSSHDIYGTYLSIIEDLNNRKEIWISEINIHNRNGGIREQFINTLFERLESDGVIENIPYPQQEILRRKAGGEE